MISDAALRPAPRGLFWAGWVVSGLVILFLAFDGVTKVLKAGPVVAVSEQLGIPPDALVPIGLVLLVCTILYAVPTSAVLGAVLLTGYLGGATAIHVRAGSGPFPVLFPIGFGLLAWIGLALREPRLARTVLNRRA